MPLPADVPAKRLVVGRSGSEPQEIQISKPSYSLSPCLDAQISRHCTLFGPPPQAAVIRLQSTPQITSNNPRRLLYSANAKHHIYVPKPCPCLSFSCLYPSCSSRL